MPSRPGTISPPWRAERNKSNAHCGFPQCAFQSVEKGKCHARFQDILVGKRPSAEFRRPQAAKFKSKSVFSGDMCLGKNTAQPTSVRALRVRRSGLQPFEHVLARAREPVDFIDRLTFPPVGGRNYWAAAGRPYKSGAALAEGRIPSARPQTRETAPVPGRGTGAVCVQAAAGASWTGAAVG